MKSFDTTVENKRLTKEIISLCLDINSKTEFCAFFNFSGHVNQFDLHISKSKAEYDKEASSKFSLYLTPYSIKGDEDFDKDTQAITQSLEKVKNMLEDFLKEHSPKEPFLDFGGAKDEIPF